MNFQIHFVSLASPVSIHRLIHLSTHPSHHPDSKHTSVFHSRLETDLFEQILPTLNFWYPSCLRGALDWAGLIEPVGLFIVHFAFKLSVSFRVVDVSYRSSGERRGTVSQPL